uniref:Echotoxin-2 n=1 Tax=Monoplex parthenopeus TaxID=230564 RepID=ACTP2_MONPT|nr:RecName: Full=Echotoxin-2; Short=Echt 2; Flags: Precursor [Monoplex echo]BAD01578.2 hemolysin [Monoplex echo]
MKRNILALVVVVALISQSRPAESAGGTIIATLSKIPLSTLASALNTALETGASVASAAAAATSSDYSVTCVIEVENWTKHLMKYPVVQIANSGGLLTVAKNVLPAEIQSFAMRKAWGANGVYGTVSWVLGQTNRRVVIMWSAPYNFDFYSNWLAVGMSRPGLAVPSSRSTWFDLMYYGNSNADISFVRGEYYHSVDPIYFKNSEWEIEGSMNNIHKARVRATVKPIKTMDLASSILTKLEALAGANGKRAIQQELARRAEEEKQRKRKALDEMLK